MQKFHNIITLQQLTFSIPWKVRLGFLENFPAITRLILYWINCQMQISVNRSIKCLLNQHIGNYYCQHLQSAYCEWSIVLNCFLQLPPLSVTITYGLRTRLRSQLARVRASQYLPEGHAELWEIKRLQSDDITGGKGVRLFFLWGRWKRKCGLQWECEGMRLGSSDYFWLLGQTLSRSMRKALAQLQLEGSQLSKDTHPFKVLGPPGPTTTG